MQLFYLLIIAENESNLETTPSLAKTLLVPEENDNMYKGMAGTLSLFYIRFVHFVIFRFKKVYGAEFYFHKVPTC